MLGLFDNYPEIIPFAYDNFQSLKNSLLPSLYFFPSKEFDFSINASSITGI